MKVLATTASARVVSLEQEVVDLTKEKNKCTQELQHVQQQYFEKDASTSARVQTGSKASRGTADMSVTVCDEEGGGTRGWSTLHELKTHSA